MTGIEPAVIAAVSSAASTGVSMIQASKQQKAQQAAMAQQARARLEEIEKKRVINERRAREKLKHDMATRRARFGASGLSSSRSADAILTNLQRQTERQLADENWFFDRDANATRNSVSSSGPSLLDYGQTIIGGISGIANQLSGSTSKKSLLTYQRKGNPHF